MEWSENLSVGVPKIDEQHKALIQAVNDLFDACSKGLGRKKISDTMDFLEKYTVTHFSDEEKLQKESGYPDYPRHHQLHADFVKTVRELGAQLRAEGPSVTLVGKINMAVTGWLISHISREDKKIGEFILSK